MNINLIGAPTFYGADKKGPDLAPNKLRELGLINFLNKQHTIYDLGNVYVPFVPSENKFCNHANIKYFNTLVELNSNIAHLVYLSANNNTFPLVVGGDHSIALGSIAGISSVYKKVAVIWFDAHTDINTCDTSLSGNFHGMPLAYAMGLGHKKIEEIYPLSNEISCEDVYIIGARDIDPGEENFVRHNNLKVYSPNYVKNNSISKVFAEIMNSIKDSNVDAIHLSFDLDFLDADLVPGTGTPVSNGFSIKDTKELLKLFASSGLVKSMDFVEYNVLLDTNNITGHLSIDLINHTIKNLI